MHWYDHLAILCALLLALWADYDAGLALRAAIVNYLSTLGEDEKDGRWVHAADMRRMFGPSAYKHLHGLLRDEIVERRVTPGGPERGWRADYWYRWRDE